MFLKMTQQLLAEYAVASNSYALHATTREPLSFALILKACRPFRAEAYPPT
eukprot:COSAG03_NODE_1664_length_3699_cov_2.498889_5_plen_51_part_00